MCYACSLETNPNEGRKGGGGAGRPFTQQIQNLHPPLQKINKWKLPKQNKKSVSLNCRSLPLYNKGLKQFSKSQHKYFLNSSLDEN